MSKYAVTEPVQVEHTTRDPDGVVATYWRNALYLGLDGEHHQVIYAGGVREVLDPQQKIRKYQPDQNEAKQDSVTGEHCGDAK